MPTIKPNKKNVIELTKVTITASLNIFHNCCGNKSSPNKYNRNIIPIFDISEISFASEIKAIPHGPKRSPKSMYATIIACLAYRAKVANTAALVNITNIENSIECSPIIP